MNDAVEYFQGRILIVAPHMDDEVLACGGLIARLPARQQVHVAYATDGTKSPAPVFPWRDPVSADLGAVRRQESEAALAVLGVPRQNLQFFNLPEGQLPGHRDELERLWLEHLERVQPDHVLVPFRYDRHPDHLAVNRVVTDSLTSGRFRGRLSEYFVYHRWRLLPRRDIRRYVRPEYLLKLDITAVADRKLAALECFASQTTRYYPWQTRPILTPQLLEEECRGPECYLRYDASMPGSRVFTGAVPWIRVAHQLEPMLQKWKYVSKTALLRTLGLNQ